MTDERKKGGMDKPKTTWKERVEVDNGEGKLRWCECGVCHQTVFMFATLDEKNNYVCLSCRADGEVPVSMRCLRHKKRFNVPKWWTDVCGHLCPKCYERLSVEERARYEPGKGIDISTREKESGKPVVYPSKSKESYFGKDEGDKSAEGCAAAEQEISYEGLDRDAIVKIECTKFRARTSLEVELPKHRRDSRAEDNPNLVGLLPKYKIFCQKCGTEYPCNYTWFDKSTVLCPSCYGAMSEYDIEEFHATHSADKPKLGEEQIVVKPHVIVDYTPSRKVKPSWIRDPSSLNSGGRWSNSQVMKASRSELLYAYKTGKVSGPRMRIELSRRKNREYYDMLPDETGLSPYALRN